MALRLHYYNQTTNFGDALCPVLVEKLSGKKVEYSHPRSAELIAVGSVLFAGSALFVDKSRLAGIYGIGKLFLKGMDAFQRPLNIWGSGFLMDTGASDVIKIRRVKISAVRGKRSLEILKRTGFVKPEEVENIALGDPGLLFPKLLQERPTTRYDLGIVPHFRDWEEGFQLGRRFAALGVNVKVIDVMQDDSVNVLREIAQCEKILSSSLHGLIVSDAFQIPNRHIVFSTLGQSVQEYLFKFDDYYSAFDIKPPECLAMNLVDGNELDVLSRINSVTCMHERLSFIQDRLVKAFPKQHTDHYKTI